MKTEKNSHCPACRQFELTDAALSNLSAAQTKKLAHHLEKCDACRTELAGIRKLILRLEREPRLTARDPDMLSRRIMTRAGPLLENRPKRFWPSWIYPAWRWAALVLMVAAAAPWIWRTISRSDTVTVTSLPAQPWVPSRSASESVLLAANWLVTAQEPDGRWASRRWQAHPSFETALNGLATLSLIEAHRLDPDPELAGAIRHALDHLSAHKHAEGRFGPDFAAAHYNHAPATLALMHGHGLMPGTVPDMIIDEALAWIMKTQNRDGGWGYLDDPDKLSKLSITYWNIQVLRTAHAQDRAHVTDSLQQAIEWVHANRAENRGFAYQRQPQSPTATVSATLNAMGFLCLNDPSTGIATRLRPAIESLMSDAQATASDPDYYRDYMLATALQSIHTDDAASTVTEIRERVRQRQIDQGPLAGSWSPDDPWSGTGGRLYTTAMAVLSQKP